MQETIVLAIDPGSAKCGVAVVSGGPGSIQINVIERAVVDRPSLPQTVKRLIETLRPTLILLGNGTRQADVLRELESVTDTPVKVVDERETTLAAGKLYFQDHPPRGWRKLLPISMQVPPEPYDDYVAVLLGRRHLASL